MQESQKENSHEGQVYEKGVQVVDEMNALFAANDPVPQEIKAIRALYPELIYHSNHNEDNWCCDICLDSEITESQALEGTNGGLDAAPYEREELVICDICLVVVHPSCYRRDLYRQDPYDDTPWYCERCQFLLNEFFKDPTKAVETRDIPSCMLCPDRQGALIQLKTKEWVHQVCVNWHNEIWFEEDDIELNYFSGNLNLQRFKKACYLCKRGSNVGSCIDCDYKNCRMHFHVRCAIKAGLILSQHDLYMQEIRTGQWECDIFCDKHTQIGKQRIESQKKLNINNAILQSRQSNPGMVQPAALPKPQTQTQSVPQNMLSVPNSSEISRITRRSSTAVTEHNLVAQSIPVTPRNDEDEQSVVVQSNNKEYHDKEKDVSVKEQVSALRGENEDGQEGGDQERYDDDVGDQGGSPSHISNQSDIQQLSQLDGGQSNLQQENGGEISATSAAAQLPLEIINNLSQYQLQSLGIGNLAILKNEIINATDKIEQIQQNKIDYHKINELFDGGKRGRRPVPSKIIIQPTNNSKKQSHILLQKSQAEHRRKVQRFLQIKRAAQGVLNSSNDSIVGSQDHRSQQQMRSNIRQKRQGSQGTRLQQSISLCSSQNSSNLQNNLSKEQIKNANQHFVQSQNILQNDDAVGQSLEQSDNPLNCSLGHKKKALQSVNGENYIFNANNIPDDSNFTSQPSVDFVPNQSEVNQSRNSSYVSHNSTITNIQQKNHISFGINEQSVSQYFNVLANSNANQTGSTPTLSKQYNGFGGAPTISSGQSAIGGPVSVIQTQSLSEMINNHQNSNINLASLKARHYQIPTTQIHQGVSTLRRDKYCMKNNSNQTVSNSLNQSTLCGLQPSVSQLNNEFADPSTHDLHASDLISHLNNKIYQPTQRQMMPTQMGLTGHDDFDSMKPLQNILENLPTKSILHNSQTFTEKNQTTKDSSQQSVFTDTALNRKLGLLNQNRLFSQSQQTDNFQPADILSQANNQSTMNKREQKSAAKSMITEPAGVKQEGKMKVEAVVKKGMGDSSRQLSLEDIDVKSKARFKIDLELAQFLEIDQWCSFREITLGLLKFNKKTGGDFYDRSTTSFNAFKYPYFLEFFPHLKNVKVKKQQKITNLDLRKYLIDKQMRK